jgi:hypothetical protein
MPAGVSVSSGAVCSASPDELPTRPPRREMLVTR